MAVWEPKELRNSGRYREVPRVTHVLALATICAMATQCGGEPSDHVTSTASALACGSPESAANTVPIRFDIPAALASHTGAVPVTFGVPFAEGLVDVDAFLGVVQETGTPCARDAQFKITARWSGAAGDTIKWLLVDTIVAMRNGEIDETYLQFDNSILAQLPSDFDWSSGFAARISPDQQNPPSVVDPTKMGSFELRATTASYIAERGEDEGGGSALGVETVHSGPVRTVLLQRGEYVLGSQRIAQHTTRYTLFRGQPYVRIHHTMVWGRDDVVLGTPPTSEQSFDYDTEQLDYLAYNVPDFGATSGCTAVQVGIKGSAAESAACDDAHFRQLGLEAVEKTVNSTTSTLPADLAGWLLLDQTDQAHVDTFVGLRWAAEQFPSGFHASTGPSVQVRLLDADDQTWQDLAEGPVEIWVDYDDVTSGPNTPTGVAKTYELWVWPTELSDPPPSTDVQNAFAQGGVYAYIDPSFAVQAANPSPMAAFDPAPAQPAVGVVEDAIANVFAYLTRDHLNPALDSSPHRFGAFNFGDTFYQYQVQPASCGDMLCGGAEDCQNCPSDCGCTSSETCGDDSCDTGETCQNCPDDCGPCKPTDTRLWMNTGSGFSSLPWILFMRSGGRAYRDFAESSARHVMDVDTWHVNRQRPYGGTSNVRTFKGGQSQYAAQHGAFHCTTTGGEGIVATKTSESESIALSWYLTGYERAYDVLLERGGAVHAEWDPAVPPTTGGWLNEALDDIVPGGATYAYPLGGGPAGGGPQGQYRIVGELAILHEAVGDVYPLDEALLRFTEAVIAIGEIPVVPSDIDSVADGWFPARGRSQWLEHSLVAAARLLPDQRYAIRGALAAWDRYHGSDGVRGSDWKQGGDRSLQATLANYDETGDVRLLEHAQGVAYGQALTVNDDASAPVPIGSSTGWRGSSIIIASYEAETIRDWLAVLGRSPVFVPSPPPYSYYLSNSGTANPPVTPPATVSEYYAVKDAGETLYLGLDYSYHNAGYPRRIVSVETFAPDGDLLDAEGYCTQTREVRFLEHLGVVDPDATDCDNPSESKLHAVPSTGVALGGVFRVRVTTPTPAGEGARPPPALNAIRVRPQDDAYLSFSGQTGQYIELANHPRLAGRNKMSLAFRMRTAGTGVQVAFGQKYRYRVYTHSNTVHVQYYLSDATSIATPVISTPFPSPWDDLEPFVSTLHIDEASGDVKITLCGGAGCATPVVASYPGYGINQLSAPQPFAIGRDGASGLYFAGDLDDIRVLPRVLTERETSDYIDGNGLWTAAVSDVAHDGEVFLFDENLAGLSGEGYTLNHGESGTDFAFVTTSAATMVARVGELVQYDPARDSASCCSLPSTGGCSATGPTPQFVGSLVTRRNSEFGDLGFCGQARPPYRGGILDFNAGFLGHTSASLAFQWVTPFCTAPLLVDPDDGELVSFLVPVARNGDWFFTAGHDPLLADTETEWFDALACERNAHVGEFGTDGVLTIRHFAIGDMRTFSFKMRSPSQGGVTHILAKPYEFRAYLHGGLLYTGHYVTDGANILTPSPAAPFPVDQWVTVTATARQYTDASSNEKVTAQLYMNGILVSETTVDGDGFNLPASPYPLVLGRPNTWSSGDSYPGRLDDVVVLDGIPTAEEIERSWYLCAGNSWPGALAFESFEGCPTGSGGFQVVDRLSGSALSCGGGSAICQ